MININSKYAFVRELPYTNTKKDTIWKPREKKVLKVPSYAKVKDGMITHVGNFVERYGNKMSGSRQKNNLLNVIIV